MLFLRFDSNLIISFNFLLFGKDFPIFADIFIDLSWVQFQQKEIDGAKKAAFNQW